MAPGLALTFGNAVRKGATLRPQARFALLSALNNGTDAIGAAAEAVGYLRQLLKTEDYGPLQKRWPVLTRRVKHPLRGQIALVQSIVHNLNDEHQWTREEIAAFVDGLEVGLAPATPVKPEARNDVRKAAPRGLRRGR